MLPVSRSNGRLPRHVDIYELNRISPREDLRMVDSVSAKGFPFDHQKEPQKSAVFLTVRPLSQRTRLTDGTMT